jgi:hypothetical protein
MTNLMCLKEDLERYKLQFTLTPSLMRPPFSYYQHDTDKTYWFEEDIDCRYWLKEQDHNEPELYKNPIFRKTVVYPDSTVRGCADGVIVIFDGHGSRMFGILPFKYHELSIRDLIAHLFPKINKRKDIQFEPDAVMRMEISYDVE